MLFADSSAFRWPPVVREHRVVMARGGHHSGPLLSAVALCRASRVAHTAPLVVCGACLVDARVPSTCDTFIVVVARLVERAQLVAAATPLRSLLEARHTVRRRSVVSRQRSQHCVVVNPVPTPVGSRFGWGREYSADPHESVRALRVFYHCSLAFMVCVSRNTGRYVSGAP